MTIADNYAHILDQIKEAASLARRQFEEITLVAVSKGCTVEEIEEAYSLGIRDFGENRIDEALFKMERLPKDIRWHYIGKLQRNKVNKVIGKFALIHSVDTFELARKLSQVGQLQDVTSSILLEVNTSGELSKSGLTAQEWEAKREELFSLENLDIQGLMTMAPLTKDHQTIRGCFSILFHMSSSFHLSILSMGMSQDFPLAIQEGATHLRIGSALFDYN